MPTEIALLAAIMSALGPFGLAAAGFWANQKGWLISGRELVAANERIGRLELKVDDLQKAMERLAVAVIEGKKEKDQ